jgi:phosphatidylserine/phosphatidylglycerophosphate/cardiolipin synthase-like enzyme
MLTSKLFAGDALLQAIADDLDQPITANSPRISRTRNRNDPAVKKIQLALLGQDPNCLPQFGADGHYGDETAAAVARFKADILLVPPDQIIDDVGPQTVLKLDELQAALEQPMPPPQPPTPQAAPEDWFLTEAEMSPFRTPAFTLDNVVTFHVDGESYLGALNDRFVMLAQGDSVLTAGWRYSPEQMLTPVNPGSHGIQDLLVGLQNQGVKVRALIYGSLASTAPFRIALPALPSKDNFDFRTGLVNAGAQAVLDARLPRFGSHHQKAFVVQSAAEGPSAFVGGIDTCLDRFDTAAHSNPPQRQREPDFLGKKVSMDGWHDVQCGVRGPAVVQLWQALSQRWNDSTPPSTIDPVPVPVDPSEDPVPQPTGTHAVQLLRTLVCNGVYSFLPRGERTVLAAYQKAIARAEHFIYIEDQYLWPSFVVDALRDAAARGVHVILVTSRDYDIPLLSGVHKAMREETLIRIASVAPGNVHLFHLECTGTTEQIYVHAKLMIVDDLYAAAGSANLNFRSQTTDSELHLGVFDTEVIDGLMGGAPAAVGRSIRELRVQLWGEHIEEDQDTLDDPIASLVQLPAPGARRGHLVADPLPNTVAPIDAREILRELLRTIQQLEGWRVIATMLLGPLGLPLAIAPGIDLGLAADLIPDATGFLRDFMNPNTNCN